jgi:hypothetical protein
MELLNWTRNRLSSSMELVEKQKETLRQYDDEVVYPFKNTR